MQKLSSDALSYLRILIDRGRIWADESSRMQQPHLLVHLVKCGFARQETENPNLLYLLPQDRRDMMFFAPTVEGIEYVRVLQDAADHLANYNAESEEKERADRAQEVADRKKQFRHDIVVAAFGVAFALFLEHFPAVVNTIKVAVEKILSLFH